MLKVNYKNTRIRRDVCSKSTIKGAEQHQLTRVKILFPPTPLILIKCSKNIGRTLNMSITGDFI